MIIARRSIVISGSGTNIKEIGRKLYIVAIRKNKMNKDMQKEREKLIYCQHHWILNKNEKLYSSLKRCWYIKRNYQCLYCCKSETEEVDTS